MGDLTTQRLITNLKKVGFDVYVDERYINIYTPVDKHGEYSLIAEIDATKDYQFRIFNDKEVEKVFYKCLIKNIENYVNTPMENRENIDWEQYRLRHNKSLYDYEEN